MSKVVLNGWYVPVERSRITDCYGCKVVQLRPVRIVQSMGLTGQVKTRHRNNLYRNDERWLRSWVLAKTLGKDEFPTLEEAQELYRSYSSGTPEVSEETPERVGSVVLFQANTQEVPQYLYVLEEDAEAKNFSVVYLPEGRTGFATVTAEKLLATRFPLENALEVVRKNLRVGGSDLPWSLASVRD